MKSTVVEAFCVVIMTTLQVVTADVRASASANDLDLIKLYLEEFRLELMSVKSQLSRMARNSKLLRTSLRELRTGKCASHGVTTDTADRRSPDYVDVGCPVGFQLSSPESCYKFVRERVTWNEARALCASYSSNAHLVALETHSEHRFITHHLARTRKLQNCDFWTAGSDEHVEGLWVWNVTTTDHNGRQSRDLSVTSHSWNSGEPNNSNDDEDCLVLDWYAKWAWNDVSCHAHRACFACELDMQTVT